MTNHVPTMERCQAAIQTATMDDIPQFQQDIVRFTQLKTEQDGILEKMQETSAVKPKYSAEHWKKPSKLWQQQRAVVQATYDTAKARAKLIQDGPVQAQIRYHAATVELDSLEDTKAMKRLALSETERDVVATKTRLVDIGVETTALEQTEHRIADQQNQGNGT
jgi:hypothetical protein